EMYGVCRRACRQACSSLALLESQTEPCVRRGGGPLGVPSHSGRRPSASRLNEVRFIHLTASRVRARKRSLSRLSSNGMAVRWLCRGRRGGRPTGAPVWWSRGEGVRCPRLLRAPRQSRVELFGLLRVGDVGLELDRGTYPRPSPATVQPERFRLTRSATT